MFNALVLSIALGFGEPNMYKEAVQAVSEGNTVYLVVGVDSGTEFLVGYEMKNTGKVLSKGDILRCYNQDGRNLMEVFERKQEVKVEKKPVLPRLFSPPVIPVLNPFPICVGGNCPR